MRIPLLSGRFLSDADDGNAPGAMLISASLAELCWPDEPPLGQQVSDKGIDWTVVGVVGDVKQEALGNDLRPAFYVPIAQNSFVPSRLTLAVRTESSDPLATVAQLRETIWSVSPDIVVDEVGTMVERIRVSEADDRFRALLMWAFASVAGLLAAVGIFSA